MAKERDKTEKETSDEELIDFPGAYRFEVYNKDGIMVGLIPYSKDALKFRIFGDRLFTIDTGNQMAIYQYKIIEN